MLAHSRPVPARMVTTPEFAAIDTAAEKAIVDPAAAPGRIPKAALALVLLTVAAHRRHLVPVEALRAAAAGPFAAENLVAIEAGMAL